MILGRSFFEYSLGIFQELFALDDEIADDGPLGLELAEGLLLPLNQLLDVLDTARSDVSR